MLLKNEFTASGWLATVQGEGGSVTLPLFLYRGMVWQCLHSSGICALEKQTVNRRNRYLVSIMEGARKTSFVIPSIPGALLSFAAEIASQTSISVMGQLYEVFGFA